MADNRNGMALNDIGQMSLYDQDRLFSCLINKYGDDEYLWGIKGAEKFVKGLVGEELKAVRDDRSASRLLVEQFKMAKDENKAKEVLESLVGVTICTSLEEDFNGSKPLEITSKTFPSSGAFFRLIKKEYKHHNDYRVEYWQGGATDNPEKQKNL